MNQISMGRQGALRRKHEHLCLLLLLVLSLYTMAFFLPHLESAAGEYPVLDGAENMKLAGQIATGSLPHAPVYRAMLYPALLAGFLKAGVALQNLPVVAGLLGWGLHLGSTICVYFLARRGWASGRAGIVAAVLFGFNPVAIYFAGEPLDTTLGMFLFLAGLAVLSELMLPFAGVQRRPGWSRWRLFFLAFMGTALWCAAVEARPHYMIVLAAFPVVWLAARRRPITNDGWVLLGFLAACVLCLGTVGLTQKRVAGKFQVMPGQGAYNLWVGNHPGANGRFYEQKIHLAAGTVVEGENPARIEAEILYRQETGDKGMIDFERLNRFWKDKTWKTIQADPAGWLELMARKVYYLFNNFEQYNNKTFAIQKDLSPALRWNPLGWGLTLVTAIGGGVYAVLARRRFLAARLIIPVGVIYGLGVIIFFVSDRFRLPLLPLICIGAGVWGGASFRRLTQLGWRGVLLTLLLAAGAGGLSFSRGWGVYDLSPAVQDYVLLSTASTKAGDDVESLRWARLALNEQPLHPDALGCAVQSFYNVSLRGIRIEARFPDETWAQAVVRGARIHQPSPGLRLIHGVALWKTGDHRQASAVLHELLGAAPVPAGAEESNRLADDTLGVLLLSALAAPDDEARAKARVNNTASFYLLAAISRRDAALIPVNQQSEAKAAEVFVRNLFP